jgi:acetyltransferase-like isoleucine patch superfamily enzyme
MFTDRGSITVGAFCSFSPEVRVLGGGEHVTTRASTFPLATRFAKPGGSSSLDSVDKGPTTIGNDVWIGLGAILLSGVTIGDGAVIGAGAVVRASVPPYAIVAGNPAELVRYRFDADVRQRLLALQWWNWDDREIFAALPWFMRGVDAFLEEMERTHRSASPS